MVGGPLELRGRDGAWDGTGCPGKEQQSWGNLWFASGISECCASASFVMSHGKRALYKSVFSTHYINEV